eukprot:3742517-Amphidinium_carterae.1
MTKWYGCEHSLFRQDQVALLGYLGSSGFLMLGDVVDDAFWQQRYHSKQKLQDDQNNNHPFLGDRTRC